MKFTGHGSQVMMPQLLSEFAKNYSLFENIEDWEQFMNDCKWTQTHKHLVHKRTLSHFGQFG